MIGRYGRNLDEKVVQSGTSLAASNKRVGVCTNFGSFVWHWESRRLLRPCRRRSLPNHYFFVLSRFEECICELIAIYFHHSSPLHSRSPS